MGWGRMLLFGNFGQQLDIEEMRSVIEDQQSRDVGQDQQIRSLQRENRQLQLAIATLLQVLVKNGTVSQTEVQEIGRAIES